MKYVNYILIIIGAFIAMYAKTGTDQNQYILIGGIVILILGVYRVSRNIPSRHNSENENNSENN
ncbi:MAG: LPXTG cell wall anchor domain-containing protein [Algibacter sp.]|uniref:LPXTG cell wall anchor domain-containing protein n=1 Tax=Algibacter sp. TaxID=1872428 RepID=UPI002613B8F8|nr:LPXTG cell wall anchor domain-containing protein [Algibacter sp.]MDG1729389.1 LPXTG cell wall anchor domain-containing protein [Algibacter sp.]MDG2178601.1 LPXTG cell wall anchor domain-containing protein [Algibacter sp.]